jgi:hypothetical protein
MQLIAFGISFTAWCLLPSFADSLANKSTEFGSHALYRELLAGLPKDGACAKSAKLELEYWHESHWTSAVRRSVMTRDGKKAEVIFLSAPSLSMPGDDLSMAFLLVERHVIDWVSCWTYNRIANHELLLEDVDGNGFQDVAFRASDGWWGAKDKRIHSRPGERRKWLYAYAITSKGFRSLFPETDGLFTPKLSYETTGQQVTLEAKGLSKSLREYQMAECEVLATNTSTKNLPIEPTKWFDVETDETSGYFMTYGPPDQRTLLKPGETVSQMIRFFLVGAAKDEIALRFKFVPVQSDSRPDRP